MPALPVDIKCVSHKESSALWEYKEVQEDISKNSGKMYWKLPVNKCISFT